MFPPSYANPNPNTCTVTNPDTPTYNLSPSNSYIRSYDATGYYHTTADTDSATNTLCASRVSG